MSNQIVPSSKPKLSQCEVLEIVESHNVKDALALVGVRGYYKDTLGKPGINDRNYYDDGIFVVSPHVFAAFNANCDPSVYRKNIANLKPGVWRYKKHKHRGRYWALGQAEPFTVIRDGVGEDTGYFGINIHQGGIRSTWSEGCQTIYNPQWQSFINLVYSEMKRCNQETIPYILTEN